MKNIINKIKMLFNLPAATIHLSAFDQKCCEAKVYGSEWYSSDEAVANLKQLKIKGNLT